MTYTINPNAKNVWIRDNEDTMDLSPITDASSVYLENGRTLEQELGEGSMVSNVATVNKSMSKVIDGTLDGVYESGVMYGRSLVNNNNNKFKEIAFNATNTTQATNYALLLDDRAGCPDLNVTMVVGKKYLILEKWTISSTTGNGHTIQPKIIDKNGDVVYFSGDGQVKGTGTFTLKRTFIPTVDVDKFYFAITNGAGVTVSGTFHYGMIIEYQEGMENWDIPYFEGICDVKMPVVKNVGKNLFKTFKNEGYYEYNGSAGSNGQWVTDVNFKCLSSKILPNTEYIQSSKDPYSGNVLTFWKDGKFTGEGIRGKTTTFTTPSNCDEIRVSCTTENDLQLELGRSATAYEDHKSNILHTPETVALRSLPNGVRDELNLKTGEYIKRIGEIVLDGSEGWSLDVEASSSENTAIFYTGKNFNGFKQLPNYADRETGILCDKFPIIPSAWHEDCECMMVNQDARIYIRVSRQKLSSADIQGLKSWLATNPTKVCCELATSIIKKVNLTQSEPIVKIGTELPNGVCDTYNLLTGEHIQRVKKVVLNGSENWKLGTVKTVTQVFELVVNDLDIKTKRNNLVCDSLPISNGDSSDTEKIASTDSTGVSSKTSSLYMALLKTKASTVEQLKTYLASNPITVWYGLKSPIVTKKNGLPNTYGVTLPNGEVDKYNESTGVYTQNVGVEHVGDNGTFDNIIQQSNGTRIHYNLGESIRPIRTKVLTDDRFTFKDTWSETHEPYSVFIGSGLDMYFVIPTSEGVTTIAQAKDWFEANKTLLYYELATPKTIDIPLINVGQVLPNGVCDTYNPITKEYVKRVSGTVLVGNEDWSLMNSPYETDCIGFVTPCSLANWTQSQANLNIVCEGYVGNYELWNVDEEGFSVFKTPTRLAIKVKRSKLSTADINGFKKFLKLTPLAVWYELATPEVSTVDLDLSTLYSSSPIAYENGHIILESSHDGQSLLPTLEYSTITNRVKQIESIGEQVLRQEKQLSMLEQMLIQGIIGMDYNNTLLTLNLEIDEVI